MRKDKFKFGFLAFLMVMNVYWSYYPPSEKYLSHTILDSKYTQRSLYKRVLVINALVLICLIIEFWYFCDHGIRGQEYAMYISIIGMASANRCLAFALHPINVYYLNRISRFTYLLIIVPIFLLIIIYFSRKTKTPTQQRAEQRAVQ